MSAGRTLAVALPSVLAAATAHAATPTVGMGDLSGVILSLVLVVGFILAAAWVVRRMPLGLGRGNGPLKVLAALPLGPRERLVLVEARGEELLIAVSPAGVFNVGAAQGKPTAARAPEPTFVLPDPT
ncbi:MAG TPA: flagellar biosynthetic protein FliO [Gammaproteobacteria bacterium]|nr:flagellar biosynthetic protein FliO [Gammaproteobacteria bacterium]